MKPVEISFRPRAITRPQLSRLTLAIPVFASVLAIGAFLYVAVRRVAYPYEIEWLESGMLEHVHRLASGGGIYTEPSFSFTQMPYAPLNFAVGALLEKVFGVHFWVLRSISLVSTLAVFALLFHLIRRETANKAIALTGVGVYAATFSVAGTYFDVAKADSLFLALTLGAVAIARASTTHKQAMVAGVVMTLALLTKQTALFVFAPVAIYLIATKWRVGLTFTAATALLTGATTLVLNVITHGWYNFFVWELLFQHDIIKDNELGFFTKDLKPFWPIGVLIVLAAPRLLARKQRWVTGFYAATIAGLAAGSWTSRLHSGGAENVLMPVFAGAGIATGLCVGALLKAQRRSAVIALVAVLSVAQLVFLRYDPSAEIPSSTDQAAGDQFISWLQTIPGDVWIVDHPAYALLAGKDTYAGEGGMEDILRGKSPTAKADLEASIATVIHEQRFAAIILDGPDDARGFPADWQRYYTQMPGSAVPSSTDFRPLIHLTGHPRDVWVPMGQTVTMPVQ